jgi:hypothetical protein
MGGKWLKFAIGVADARGKFSAGIVDTGGKQWEQYQIADNTSRTGGKFAAGAVDTGGAPLLR